MDDNEKFDPGFNTENIPINEEFWNYMESYWHNNREFPESTESALNRKADLVGGKVPAAQLPSFANNDTLSDVLSRGNIANTEIKFHDNAKLWYDLPTFSYYFNNNKPPLGTGKYNTGIGNASLSSNTSGESSIAIGSNSLEKSTTGSRNSGLGNYSLGSSTTGNSNTGIGYAAGYSNIGGRDNTYIGAWSAGYLTNGSKNTFLGNNAGVNHGKTTSSGAWGWNTFIGYNAAYTAHAMGTYGDNNVVIGANAPLGPESNMLVIHSMTAARRHDQTQPFIKGSFTDKWLDFDSSLRVLRLPQADASYTKNLVAKPDGTFGLSSKPFRAYIALLEFDQSTFDSAITVLENTLIGDIVWTRLRTGQYEGKLPEGFVRNKTWIHADTNQFGDRAHCEYSDNNTVLLKTVNLGGDSVDVGGTLGILEIRVYQ